MKYDSDYSIRLKMVEQMGGDVTKKYDSVYSIDLEILRLMEEGGGGGNSAKVVIFNIDEWYKNPNNYQTEMLKAIDDIYNEISNERSVTVILNNSGNYTETSNVHIMGRYDVVVYALKRDKIIYEVRLFKYNDSIRIERSEKKLLLKGETPIPYVYTDGRIELDDNNSRVSEFISEPTVDNEEFVVIKTTVPAYTGTDNPNNQVYKAMSNNRGYRYYLSKFGGMKLFQNEHNANFDLIPDGEWYVIFGDIAAATYRGIIVSKAVRNVDKTLDVYLGFKGIDLDSYRFYDCTVENKGSQGSEGKWNEKNWVKVSDAENISVDSFIGRRTRYFCTNTEGVKVDRIVLFKRMK